MPARGNANRIARALAADYPGLSPAAAAIQAKIDARRKKVKSGDSAVKAFKKIARSRKKIAKAATTALKTAAAEKANTFARSIQNSLPDSLNTRRRRSNAIKKRCKALGGNFKQKCVKRRFYCYKARGPRPE